MNGWGRLERYMDYREQLALAWEEGNMSPTNAVNPYRASAPISPPSLQTKHEPYKDSPPSVCVKCHLKRGKVQFVGMVYCELHCPCTECSRRASHNA